MYNRVNWKDGQTELCDTNFNIMDKGISDIDHLTSQIANPNLLINGDFQVWQRGTNFSISSGQGAYTADRFYFANEGVSGGVVVQKDPNGMMKITAHTEEGQYSNLRYYPEISEVNKWIGKTLTATIDYYNEYYDNWNKGVDCFDNGSIGNIQIDNISSTKIDLGSGWIRKVVVFRINAIRSDASWFHIQFLRANGNTIFGYHLVRSIKLEVGDTTTPLYPRPYSEEMLLCQRYFQRLNSENVTWPHIGVAYGKNLRVNLCCPLRSSTPKVTLQGNLVFLNASSAISGISLDRCSNTTLKLNTTVNPDVPTQFYIVEGSTSDSDILIDAEIY